MIHITGMFVVPGCSLLIGGKGALKELLVTVHQCIARHTQPVTLGMSFQTSMGIRDFVI